MYVLQHEETSDYEKNHFLFHDRLQEVYFTRWLYLAEITAWEFLGPDPREFTPRLMIAFTPVAEAPVPNSVDPPGGVCTPIRHTSV
jgi:hypothetical protein